MSTPEFRALQEMGNQPLQEIELDYEQEEDFEITAKKIGSFPNVMSWDDEDDEEEDGEIEVYHGTVPGLGPVTMGRISGGYQNDGGYYFKGHVSVERLEQSWSGD